MYRTGIVLTDSPFHACHSGIIRTAECLAVVLQTVTVNACAAIDGDCRRIGVLLYADRDKVAVGFCTVDIRTYFQCDITAYDGIYGNGSCSLVEGHATVGAIYIALLVGLRLNKCRAVVQQIFEAVTADRECRCRIAAAAAFHQACRP